MISSIIKIKAIVLLSILEYFIYSFHNKLIRIFFVLIFSKIFNSKISYRKVWFTDQNSKPLVIEGKINILVVI